MLSPNGDGVAETEQLSYKIVRPSTVTAQELGPDGVARSSFTGQVTPGTYPLTFAGKRADGTPEVEGRWRWLVSATDDLGRASSIERGFSLDLTLGFPKSVGPALAVPRRSPRAVAAFTLTRAAVVTASVETASGVVLRVLARKRYEPGAVQVAGRGNEDRRHRLLRPLRRPRQREERRRNERPHGVVYGPATGEHRQGASIEVLRPENHLVLRAAAKRRQAHPRSRPYLPIRTLPAS